MTCGSFGALGMLCPGALVQPCTPFDSKVMYRPDDPLCTPLCVVLAYAPDGTVKYLLDGEEIDMADFEPVVASDDLNTFVETQITSFKLRDAFDGDVAAVHAAALAAVAPAFTLPDGTEVPATDAEICDFNYRALACRTLCLPDGETDPANAVPVEADGTFVNGVNVRAGGDPEKGGADLTAPVSQIADAVSVWCFNYRLELDKNGEPVSA